MAGKRVKSDVREELFSFVSVDTVESTGFDRPEKDRYGGFLDEICTQVKTEFEARWDKPLGDGFAMAFPVEELRSGCDPAVSAAFKIIELIRHQRTQDYQFANLHARVCVDVGIGVISRRDMRSNTLDVLIKHLEKKGGIADAVVVTERVRNRIGSDLRDRFLPHSKRGPDGETLFRSATLDELQDSVLLQVAYDLCDQQRKGGDKYSEVARKHSVTEQQTRAMELEAEKRGIIRMTVLPPAESYYADKLKQKFDWLLDVSIIPYAHPAYLKRALGERAAYESYRVLTQQMATAKDALSIAPSCGLTLWEWATALERMNPPHELEGLLIYSLILTMCDEWEEPSPAGIAIFLQRVFPKSKVRTVQLPRYVQEPEKARDRKKFYAEECRPIIEAAERADIMFTGIGVIGGEGTTHSFNALIRDLTLVDTLHEMGAVGEVCYQPIGEKGQILMDSADLEPLRNNLIYVDLNIAKRKVETGTGLVFAIAGGEEKHAAVAAATQGHLFNCLVTDEETARYLLKAI